MKILSPRILVLAFGLLPCLALGAVGSAGPPASAAPGGMAGADALLSAGDNAAAARAYEALGSQRPSKREGWRQNNWGLALMRMDNPAEAAGHFQSAVEADPTNFIARANLGAAWERVGDLTKTLEVYRTALRLVRAENRALARGRHGPEADQESREPLASPSPESAPRRLAEKACALGPRRLKAALAKANALLDKGLYAEAGAGYAAIGRVSSPVRESWRLNNWGLCYLRLADPFDARERLERAVEAFPRNSVAWDNLAVACEELGLTRRAAQAWTRGGRVAGSREADPRRLELVRLKLDFADARRRWEALRR